MWKYIQCNKEVTDKKLQSLLTVRVDRIFMMHSDYGKVLGDSPEAAF